MMRVVVVGMGSIGVACARAVAADADMDLVGLVDVDPVKAGLTLTDLADQIDPSEDDQHIPLRISPWVEDAAASGANLAILTTSSHFDRMAPTLKAFLEHGVHVVSSCEEMAWPWYRHADLAREMDELAQAHRCCALGTGVNPGFVMDSLAVALSTAVRRVNSVRCVRRVEAGLRRLALQAKIGATLTTEQFQQRAAAGKMGHQGLAESVALVAAGLGHEVSPGAVTVALEPVVTSKPLTSALGMIEPGRVSGMRNTAHWADDHLSVDMDLAMAVGLEEPKDFIELGGPVAVKFKVICGLPGDSATVAILLNTGRVLPSLAPGLKTMLDLPPAGCRGRERNTI